MRPNQVNNVDFLTQARRDLRNNATEAEVELWKYLRSSQLENRKFRRQHSVGAFILDFYCPAERLAVELDGAQHDTREGIEDDENRTAYLNEFGIKVLRFKNEVVFNDIDAVLAAIKLNFEAARW